MRRFIVVIFALILGMSLAACSGNSNSAPEFDTTGQYINCYLASEPQTLDVNLRSDAYSSMIIINTMEGLIRFEEKDGGYYIAPAGAESWESNEEGTVWTFHLRESAWEDGVPVTAGQYVYSLKRCADPKTGSPSSFFLKPLLNYDAISTGDADVSELGVRAVDDYTLEITLSAPTPSFLSLINATVYYPVREDYVEEWGNKFGTKAEYCISNGPFRIESWTHNSSIVLVKNDNYWDEKSVNLSRVNIRIMKDETSYYNAFESEEIDYVSVGSLEWLNKFNDGENKYIEFDQATNVFQFYNTKDPIFQNIKIRKAFTLAIDREDINDMCFSGLRNPAYGWVPASMSVGETNYRKQAGDMIKEMLAELEAEGKTPKDLLIEGMRELGLGDDPSTLKITYSLAGTNERYRTIGEYLQQIYKDKLGIELKISYSSWGIFYNRVQRGNYQIGFMSWGAYYNDPYDMLSLFSSGYDAISTGWVNQKYDSLLIAGNTEMDESKRIQYYIDAETIFLKDECVVAPLSTMKTHTFVKNFVNGYSTLNFTSSGFKYVYTTER